MADNIIPSEKPLGRGQVSKDQIRQIIESGKLHPPQFKLSEFDKTLSQEMKAVNANPEVTREFLELEAQPSESPLDKDAKRVKQLTLAHDNLPTTWMQIYGSRSAQEVFEEEKKTGKFPPQGSTPPGRNKM